MQLFKKEKTEKKPVKPRTPAQKAWEFFKNLLFAAVAALVIKTFLIETSRVPTGSMETTIMVGDFLFVNKFIYGSSSPRNIPFTDIALPYFQMPAISDPKKGDIVVFEFEGERDELKSAQIMNYVKRLIGTPGDTVEIRNKVVFVNGKEAKRPTHIRYSESTQPKGVPDFQIFPKGENWNKDNYGPLVIPKEGDVINLNVSNIEKWRTIIDREHEKRVVQVNGDKIFIDGKEATTYTLKKDYYFMMGDNRDESWDSRFWGFVPRDKIVGEAFLIYWSWDPAIEFSDFFKLLGSTRLNRIAKFVH